LIDRVRRHRDPVGRDSEPREVVARGGAGDDEGVEHTEQRPLELFEPPGAAVAVRALDPRDDGGPPQLRGDDGAPEGRLVPASDHHTVGVAHGARRPSVHDEPAAARREVEAG